ncbi:MAG: hybrid sensor histidine kinase/response regulator [Pseudomonadota bacterium]
MNKKEMKNLADASMLELFRLEVEQHAAVLTEGLLRLEEDPGSPEKIEPLMRAAHSIKGAARLVGLSYAVGLAHKMEDCLVAAQSGKLSLAADDIDLLLKSVDMLALISDLTHDENVELPHARQSELSDLEDALAVVIAFDKKAKVKPMAAKAVEKPTQINSSKETDVAAEHLGGEGGSSAKKTAKKAAPRKTPAPGQEISAPSPAEINSFGTLTDPSMMELFRLEVEQQGQVLTDGLLQLEEDPISPERIEPLMRAAHSIKGAARLVGVNLAVGLAHRMEDCLVAAQTGKLHLSPDDIDVLLKSSDMLCAIGHLTGESAAALSDMQQDSYDQLLDSLSAVLAGHHQPAKPALMPEMTPVEKLLAETDEAEEISTVHQAEEAKPKQVPIEPIKKEKEKNAAVTQAADRVLRISAEQLNRLMGLAGESMVEARWLRPYAESMLRFKRRQAEIVTLLDGLREQLDENLDRDKLRRMLRDAQGKAAECRQILGDRLAELESYDRRAVNLSSRLRREVVTSRMRPFGDGVQGFPRMIRDLARQLGKQVQLQIDGQATMVDRDILEKIEAPLNHLLRNSMDHGIEPAEQREAAGKPARGTIRLSAYHQSGMLSVVVEDDGRGVDTERLRKKVVERKLVTQEMAANLNEAELMEFLFLPSFSTKDEVTEISGRGVGLDVVHDVVQEMRGMVRATSQLGSGTRFQLQLPLTLSVLPALLVEIADEPYAFPLARIERIMHVPRQALREVEGHQYISVEDHHVGLVSAYQVFGFGEVNSQRDELPVVVLGERKNSYGLVVDRFLGERDLVVHVLPPQLGKIKDISSAALMENGAPLLVVDVDDMLRSIEKIVMVGRLNRVGDPQQKDEQVKKKRILVVDDSITVREVERKLLTASGYSVDVAVDGMDGWNALREGNYDLVISDIDMPRMDGIELVRMIRQDDKYRDLPVMIVSYKDREEDRYRGMEAGANYYLTKGSFHDETLREAVVDLIGVAA